MKYIYQKKYLLANKYIVRFLITGAIILLVNLPSIAQCPPNIDFEEGTFNGWQCWTGNVATTGTLPNLKNVITWDATSPGPPQTNRHTMLSANPGNGIDPFGLFPKNCPNGSGHSIMLGNTLGGHQAEGVSYTFTIPAGQNKFNIIYNYAVVFQGPQHENAEQPRLVIEVTNLTDGGTVPCTSFDFYYKQPDPLPGFQLSTTNNTGTPVWFKPWAANSISLDGNAGKTFRIFFKTADCTFTAHFGYAYVDLNTECSSAFTGATFCPDDTTVTVTAPYGYAEYTWWNGTQTIQLGNTQSITLKPPPLAGDSLLVDVLPYNGYGCATQYKAYLFDTLTIRAIAGPDQKTCDNNPVQLGAPPEAGRVYKWTPATGLSDPNISNPIATPSVSTQYTLTVTNNGGGCATPDIVNVNVDIMSDSLQLIGPAFYCIASGQSDTLRVLPHDSTQWFKDNVAIPGPPGQQQWLKVTQSGAYYAMVFSHGGCSRTTRVQQIDIYDQPIAGFTLNTATQCDAGNLFAFINTSTVSAGSLQYDWNFGDNSTANIPDPTHAYAQPGNYTVTLVVTAPGGCKDTKTINVTVNPSPVASFKADAAQQCFKNNLFTFTNGSTVSPGTLNYAWDFGDLVTDNAKDVTHHYAAPGTYLVKLRATESIGGCYDDSLFNIVVQQSPVSSFTIDNNIQCFPGHQFVLTNTTTIESDPLQYTWYMGDGVSNSTKEFKYSYAKAGDYTITMIAYTASCKDTSVHAVIVHPTPSADFAVRSVCENLPVPVINRTFNNTTSTINYMWDFGNGHLDNMTTPAYRYPAGGTYPLSLTVTTVECPVSYNTKTINVTIDAPAAGIVYADKDAAFNFPEPLSARSIGNSVTWAPPTSLSNRFSYTPTFTGLTPQLYTITLRTATGCTTVDTQLVKTHKKIEIYVPTGFTVNGDGINDRLRPVLIGFSKVNYFRIYNRWGKLLYGQSSDLPGWDGKINNKPAETQTVVWMIEAVDVDGVVHQQQGTTVLFR